MYYDASKVSDLEQLLQTTEISPFLLERARLLRERIVKYELTKYNQAAKPSHNATVSLKELAAERKMILVPGQVETDASIKFGSPTIRQNMALLQTVRAANSDAYLIYKPHPDIVAGLRAKGEGENQARQWCDALITDHAIGELLSQVDEVHLLTSLTGFEALLRGKQVTCYGQPFYAGWGLTTDKEPISRRTRRLSLDELVAAALILYPTYVSPSTQHYLTAEQALDELLAWRANAGDLPRWRKAIRPVRRVLRPWLNLIGIR
jgi:capsular polysaccharide export protein